MEFRTKIDFSNNRQVKQRQQTTSDLLGKNIIGLPFSGLTSGPNYSTMAVTSVFENVTTTFNGNLTATTFNYGVVAMSAGTPYMTTVTPANFSNVRTIEPHLVGVNPHINPKYGNTVFPTYTGVGFDFTVTNFVEYAPNQFSGTAISELVSIYTTQSLDYDGDGVWLDVQGGVKSYEVSVRDYLKIPKKTPTSSSDIVGVEGNLCFDLNYLYIKTSAGWKRINISTF